LLPSRTASSKAASLTRGFVREAQLGHKPIIQQTVGSSEEKDIPKRLESMSILLPKR
jgi:hypothetical protein